jgi:signal transduction histidine kinase
VAAGPRGGRDLLRGVEALANAAEHARASAVQVEIGADDATVRLTVHDDGIGGADTAGGPD